MVFAVRPLFRRWPSRVVTVVLSNPDAAERRSDAIAAVLWNVAGFSLIV